MAVSKSSMPFLCMTLTNWPVALISNIKMAIHKCAGLQEDDGHGRRLNLLNIAAGNNSISRVKPQGISGQPAVHDVTVSVLPLIRGHSLVGECPVITRATKQIFNDSSSDVGSNSTFPDIPAALPVNPVLRRIRVDASASRVRQPPVVFTSKRRLPGSTSAGYSRPAVGGK